MADFKGRFVTAAGSKCLAQLQIESGLGAGEDILHRRRRRDIAGAGIIVLFQFEAIRPEIVGAEGDIPVSRWFVSPEGVQIGTIVDGDPADLRDTPDRKSVV